MRYFLSKITPVNIIKTMCILLLLAFMMPVFYVHTEIPFIGQAHIAIGLTLANTDISLFGLGITLPYVMIIPLMVVAIMVFWAFRDKMKTKTLSIISLVLSAFMLAVWIAALVFGNYFIKSFVALKGTYVYWLTLVFLVVIIVVCILMLCKVIEPDNTIFASVELKEKVAKLEKENAELKQK